MFQENLSLKYVIGVGISSDGMIPFKKVTIKGGYIKNSERKKVANATPTNSIAFLETPTDYIEPKNTIYLARAIKNALAFYLM